MKTRIKKHLTFFGGESIYPQQRSEAIRIHCNQYEADPSARCPVCGRQWIRYTISNECIHCARKRAERAFQEAREQGEPLNPIQAKEQGKAYYWQPYSMRACGHVGKLTLSGCCYTCFEKGGSNKWFKMIGKCSAPIKHRANDVTCQRCEEKRGLPPRAPEIPLLPRICPDLFISREDARIAGFAHYRVHEPCKRGHTGWRYVSTGGCLECLGRLTAPPT